MDKNSIYESFNEFKGNCSDFAIDYLKSHYEFGEIDPCKGAETLWNIIDKYISNVYAMMAKDDIKAEFEKELNLYIETLSDKGITEKDKKDTKKKIEAGLTDGLWIETTWQKLKKILNINKDISKDDAKQIGAALDMREEQREVMEHTFRQIEIAEVIDKIDEKNISEMKYEFISKAFFSPIGSEEEMILQKICAVDILCQHGQVSKNEVSAEKNPCFNALAAAEFMYDKISELKLGLIEAVVEAALMEMDEKLANN